MVVKLCRGVQYWPRWLQHVPCLHFFSSYVGMEALRTETMVPVRMQKESLLCSKTPRQEASRISQRRNLDFYHL